MSFYVCLIWDNNGPLNALLLSLVCLLSHFLCCGPSYVSSALLEYADQNLCYLYVSLTYLSQNSFVEVSQSKGAWRLQILRDVESVCPLKPFLSSNSDG